MLWLFSNLVSQGGKYSTVGSHAFVLVQSSDLGMKLPKFGGVWS